MEAGDGDFSTDIEILAESGVVPTEPEFHPPAHLPASSWVEQASFAYNGSLFVCGGAARNVTSVNSTRSATKSCIYWTPGRVGWSTGPELTFTMNRHFAVRTSAGVWLIDTNGPVTNL